MKKYILGLVMFFGVTGLVYAEAPTSAAPVSEPAATAEVAVPTVESVAAEAAAPAEEAAPAAAAPAETAPVEAVAAEVEAAENLEFISGEVSAIDEASKTVTIKLYGETENTPGDKSITVTVEDTTDITDGEKDRTLKSLANGTEVDVEYDPASNKATYIFVY